MPFSEFPVLRPVILLVQLVLDINPTTSPGASVFFFLIFIILSDSSRIEAPEHSAWMAGKSGEACVPTEPLHTPPLPRPCLTPLRKNSLILEFLLHYTLRGTQFTSFNSFI